MSTRPLYSRGLIFYLLPLTVLAFSAPAVNYINAVFTTNTRWLVLALLFVSIATRSEVFSILQTGIGAAAFAYGGWCISTALWSDVPALSFMKASSLLVLIVSMFAAGQIWMRHEPVKNAIGYSLPMAALALFSGIAGQASAASQVELGTGLFLYQGLSSNPNMFGSIMAMGLPVLLWRTYRAWRDGRRISIWSVSTAAVLAFLLASQSRASLLVAITIFCGFIATLRPQHRLTVMLVAVAGTILTIVLAPSVQDYAKLYIKKGGSTVMFSREQVWAESYKKAVAGGVIGVGYGVTAGEKNFELSLTSFGYGREKGNSQFAIVEETGLTGFAFYLVFLLSASVSILRGIRMAPDLDTRVMLGIMGGTWVGMNINSVFEAWWVAPGSAEAVWFWALTGVLVACLKTVNVQAEQRSFRAPVRISGYTPA